MHEVTSRSACARASGALAALAIISAIFTACPSDTANRSGSTANQNIAPGNKIAEPACTSDSECGQGKGCARDVGECIPFAIEGRTYSVLLDPRGVSNLVPDQFASVAVGPTGVIDLTMSQPVLLKGVVGHSSDTAMVAPKAQVASGLQVTGHIVAVAPGKIPGTQFTAEADFDPKKLEKTFTLRLLPGVEYDIAFLPDPPPDAGGSDPVSGAPILALPSFHVAAKFTASGQFDIVLPPKSAYTTVQGVVLMDDDTPISGAVVTSFTESDVSGTSAVTGEAGKFAVLLPPGVGVVTFRVNPGKSASHAFPTAEFQYAGQQDLKNSPFQKLVIGPIPPQRKAMIQVLGSGEAGVAPVALTKVKAWGKIGKGEFSASGTTDVEGIVTLDLIEGPYVLTIVPPQDSQFAASQQSLDLWANQDAGSFQVTLDRRIRVSGKVVQATGGDAVAGAVVSLMSNSFVEMKGSPIAPPEIGFDVVTDKTGKFDLWVDEGRYALTVVPPVETGLPRFSQPDLDLQGGDKLMTVPVPAGRLVHGRVLAAPDKAASEQGTTAVAGAQVQFFFDLPSGVYVEDQMWSVQNTSFATTVQFIGSSETDAKGGFSVVVPESATGDFGPPKTGTGPGGNGGEHDEAAPTPFGYPGVDVDTQ